MTLKDLTDKIQAELIEVLNEGGLSQDLSGLRTIKNDYLSGSKENRVLSALSEKIDGLVNSDIEDRVEAFLELNELIQKLSVSLLEFKTGDAGEVLDLPVVESRVCTYNEVKNLQKALAQKSGGRLSLIRESIARETYRAHQLLPYFVESITETYGEVSQLIVEEILPFYGRNATPLVMGKLTFKGGAIQQRILSFLLKYLRDEEKKTLVSDVLREGDSELKKYVLKSVERELFKEDELKLLLRSRSRELRDLAQEFIEKYS